MRGEDNIAMSFVLPQIETPPHAWGRHAKVSLERPKKGNTPTCVGKTRACPPAIPRARETPPHAWGRRRYPHVQKHHGGNTPTCVGKTGMRRRRCGQSWKHPHMRGEDRLVPNFAAPAPETPPHAWGRPCWEKLRKGSDANTPTCVGKTPRKIQSLDGRRKHPHMRGEDAITSAHVPVWEETPPHAWGRLRLKCPDLASIRNTPTCVGKTKRIVRHDKVIWKHPHMRGEDSSRLQGKHCKAETPPHAWGRQRFSKQTGRKVRNTPTCVGKTAARAVVNRAVRKHPHMRGEDFRVFGNEEIVRETPPHAWGRPYSL